MNKREKANVVKEIAQACEKAFRRGFQQGHAVGQEQPAVTQGSVAKWRDQGSLSDYSTAEGPPGTIWSGQSQSVVQRLKMETQHLTELSQFILEAEGE